MAARNRGVPVPPYPLSQETIEGAIEKLELPWTVQEIEEEPIYEREDYSAYVFHDTEERMVAVMTCLGNREKRFLKMDFMPSENDQWNITASLAREDWEKTVKLVTLLFGGFESEDQITEDFLANPNLDTPISEEASSQYQSELWEWEEDGVIVVAEFQQPAHLTNKEFYQISIYNDKERYTRYGVPIQ